MARKKDDLSGWGGGEEEHEKEQYEGEDFPHFYTLVLIAANLVLIMWLASGVVGIWTGSYEMMKLVTPIIGVLATFLFGKPIVDRIRDRNAP